MANQGQMPFYQDLLQLGIGVVPVKANQLSGSEFRRGGQFVSYRAYGKLSQYLLLFKHNTTQRNRQSLVLLDGVDDGENRQVHPDDDGADHEADEDHHEGLE